jgi:hypothetical protein
MKARKAGTFTFGTRPSLLGSPSFGNGCTGRTALAIAAASSF